MTCWEARVPAGGPTEPRAAGSARFSMAPQHRAHQDPDFISASADSLWSLALGYIISCSSINRTLTSNTSELVFARYETGEAFSLVEAEEMTAAPFGRDPR